MATWSEDIESALRNLGGVSTLSGIYAEVKKIRPTPHPKALKATVRGAIERNSSDSEAYASGKDLFFSVQGLGAGVWGLRSHLEKTPIASDIGEFPMGSEAPEYAQQTVYRILRDSELARKIKLLHEHTCQLCETKILLINKPYSEAHHIKPLGFPHYGPDIAENIIVVCPNCHASLDFFALELQPGSLRKVDGHDIALEYIRYHNEHVSAKFEKTR